MLRWPHDHHRDFRARLSAQAHSGIDQDQLLMTPSPLIDDRTRTNRSRRRSTGNARARARPPIFVRPHAANVAAATRRRLANRRTHRQNDRPNRFNPNSSSQPPRPNPHSARGTAVTCSTAISCLGAFRTPAASAAARSSTPASENLHTSRTSRRVAFHADKISVEWRARSSNLRAMRPTSAKRTSSFCQISRPTTVAHSPTAHRSSTSRPFAG